MAALADNPTCPAGYSYAGLWDEIPDAGVAATITPLDAARVDKGHVAAWVNLGANNGWIQVGMNATPGTPQKLYYEYSADGVDSQYVQINPNIPVGQSHRLVVMALPSRPDTFRIFVDGVQQGPDITLPGSAGKWRASVSAENWRPDDGTCNYYNYGFKNVSVQSKPGARWDRGQTLFHGVDPGYKLTPDALSGTYEALGHL